MVNDLSNLDNLIDIALSIGTDTTDARQIDAVINAIAAQQQTEVVKDSLQAAYLNGFIQEAARRLQGMIADAQTPEARRAILPVVDRLQHQIEATAAQLEALADG